MTLLIGIKYDCPECNKWWIAMDDSQELPSNGDAYCPYCDDYTHMTKTDVTLELKE